MYIAYIFNHLVTVRNGFIKGDRLVKAVFFAVGHRSQEHRESVDDVGRVVLNFSRLCSPGS